jgi:uncharacterized protein YcfJ
MRPDDFFQETSMNRMAMIRCVKTAFAALVVAVATQAAAQVTFYEGERFEGRSFTTQRQVGNFERYGFNDRASSVIVRGDRWEVCEDIRFNGRCAVLREGRYPSLAAMGLNDRVSSVRNLGRSARIDDERYGPVPVYDASRRNNERLFEADVTSVRAVVGQPEQRCWVERAQVEPDHSSANIPAAIAGAVIGGILGHQVGGGRGKDIATAGGAVAGAVAGGTIFRDNGGQPVRTQDVRRCTTAPAGSRPDYWDVTYTFRGQEHHVQMASPPGRTVTVNRQGEPRAG